MAAPDPVAAKPPPAWLMKGANPVLRRLLRSPLASRMGDRLVLLEFAGRRSGKPYALPVAATRVGDELLVGTKKGWKGNFRGGHPASVWIGGAKRPATAELVEDPAALADRYAAILPANPQFARFVGLRVGGDGRPLPEDVTRAAAEGHAVVVIRPA